MLSSRESWELARGRCQMYRSLVVLAACFLAFSACTSSGKSGRSGGPSTADRQIGWATEAREATGILRTVHVDPNGSTSNITRAYMYAASVCELAIAETESDPIKRACATMGRAATTPRISAPAIYEDALGGFDAAGAKPSRLDLSESTRGALELKVFDAQDPLSKSPQSKQDWATAFYRVTFFCRYVLRETVSSGCRSLDTEFHSGDFIVQLFDTVPIPYAPLVANVWQEMRATLFPEAPTPTPP